MLFQFAIILVIQVRKLLLPFIKMNILFFSTKAHNCLDYSRVEVGTNASCPE